MLKNKLVALATAIAVMATPVAAMAAVSPSTVTSSTTASAAAASVTASVSANKVSGNDWIKVEPAASGEIASNVPEADKDKVVASFVITHQGTEAPYTFSYTLGSEYAGATVTVYIQHDDDTTEVVTKVADANGTITFTQDKLSIHTLVAEKTNGSAASTDTSARSPQTGVNTAAVAGISIVAVVAAGGVAVTLRKKVNE